MEMTTRAKCLFNKMLSPVLMAFTLIVTSLGISTAVMANDAPYPNKPLKWIVAFPAGGAADFFGSSNGNSDGPPNGSIYCC